MATIVLYHRYEEAKSRWQFYLGLGHAYADKAAFWLSESQRCWFRYIDQTASCSCCTQGHQDAHTSVLVAFLLLPYFGHTHALKADTRAQNYAHNSSVFFRKTWHNTLSK